MKIAFPSPGFDDTVAAVCHGEATDIELSALNMILRNDPSARDEYLLRIELHSRLASDPDLFPQAVNAADNRRLPGIGTGGGQKIRGLNPTMPTRRSLLAPALAVAACLMLIAGTVWTRWFKASAARKGATSTAVAMLTRTVDAHWDQRAKSMRVGGALEPGSLRLESGLAQVVFYSGARMVIEGPTELQLVSPLEAVCPTGRLLLEVPPPAHGFRLKTSQLNVVDLGTSFGIDATRGQTALHVFKGKVEFSASTLARQSLGEGRAAIAQGGAPLRLTAANSDVFTPMFEFQQRSMASEAYRYEQWQFASAQLNRDPCLLVRLDFESPGSKDWTLVNTTEKNRSAQEATVVGCARAEGRWREKQALEFQSVNDRVRLAVPGDFNALTLSAWVCVKGLDRQFNSLFMSDGFDPGTVHWLIRNDGVLGLTVFGPGNGKFQILASPPAITLDKLGMWQHLTVVIDGKARQVVHYVNGLPVSRHPLKFEPPFRVGSAELGNWNARSGPDPAPTLIRNLSGSLDEFELFSRALSDAEVRELYAKGKPDV